MEDHLEYYEVDDYAGFWLRVVSYIIDALLVGAIIAPIFILTIGTSFIGMAGMNPDQIEESMTPELMISMFAGMTMMGLFSVVAVWLYFALMESSSKQGTLGKLAVGIKVTDQFGDQISFGRASGRYFGKILSGMIMNIGYLMVAFTEKRQGLHDILASTLVLKKDTPPLK